MAGVRALQKRLARLEDAGKPKPSLIAVWFGSFDAWVEQAVLPGVESGALAADDMVDLVACLRRWETDGTWGQAYAG
ncbi:hypothetical protein KFK14_07830 [Sphingobium phenoxybenzoativorans]|uniref:Uncharacterized protein n=1 Tax=Sphingobium phenoxybenzoativorans TaxID=1592790 RepID=A0A975K9J0_9SPHN|nr:hypothetical protein [Sphingobium phenoxybenzoativorans]QUT07305.1 hypothetical protein KFK14_07830 [Sphingobium phenoxybenzoativorans]